MKFALVLALACVAASIAAPINQEELLQNIETAAEQEANEAHAVSERMEAQVSAEKQTIEANKAFAGEMSAEIRSDTMDLKEMTAMEQETIADADAIKADAASTDVQDIESKDADATKTSNDIQSVAENLDKKLLGAIDKMKDVGVVKKVKKVKKVAQLGESNFAHISAKGDFQERLQQTEDEARRMVDAGKEAVRMAQSEKEGVDQELTKEAGMAKAGMAQLRKAETQLHRDLNGHRDAQLEADIAAKAEDIEQHHIKLGESQSPLESAMAAAEAAANEPAQNFEAAPATENYENYAAPAAGVPNLSGNVEAQPVEAMPAAQPMEMPESAQSYAQSGDGAVANDYSAISSDADGLKSYQTQSLKEIEQIEKPLS